MIKVSLKRFVCINMYVFVNVFIDWDFLMLIICLNIKDFIVNGYLLLWYWFL